MRGGTIVHFASGQLDKIYTWLHKFLCYKTVRSFSDNLLCEKFLKECNWRKTKEQSELSFHAFCATLWKWWTSARKFNYVMLKFNDVTFLFDDVAPSQGSKCQSLSHFFQQCWAISQRGVTGKGKTGLTRERTDRASKHFSLQKK